MDRSTTLRSQTRSLAPSQEAPRRPPVAVGILASLAAAKVLLHLFAINHYGYFRDELYYLASTDHLDWGYVDHPPLSIAILWLTRWMGDSLFALRIPAVLAGAATVFVTGLIARELGGRRAAQGIAALGALMSAAFLSASRFYSMNAFELLFWATAAWVLLRALGSMEPKWWLILGVVLGLGLLNKISMFWFIGGSFVALLMTRYRRVLKEPWPWAAAGIAAFLFLPHAIWQVAYGFPTLEFMRNAATGKMAELSPAGFLLEQIMSMNVGGAPIWMAGLFFGLFSRSDARGRVLVWIYFAVAVLLLAFGNARASYLAPAYCGLLALGGVAIERFSQLPRWKWTRPAAITLAAASGIVGLPMVLPVLPIETFVRYQSALGITSRAEERHEMGVLPQHYADMFGWEELTALVHDAYQNLTPEERASCRVFGGNYGEAGAIDVLGKRLGLPRALSPHNSYWLWGRNEPECAVMIMIGGEPEEIRRYFEDIEIVGQTASPWSMPYERGLNISIARRPKFSLDEAWQALKNFN